MEKKMPYRSEIPWASEWIEIFRSKPDCIMAIDQASFSFKQDALTYITHLQYHREFISPHILHTYTHILIAYCI